jgi:hypothetical protein
LKLTEVDEEAWTLHGFRRTMIVALGIAALAVPAGALASHGESHGKGKGTSKGQKGDHGKAKGHRPHNVAWVFKGYYKGDGSASGEGSIEVRHGNSRVRKGGYIGDEVAFDLSGARIVVADANGDGKRDLDDVAVGDWVLVKARLPRSDPGDQPFEAKRLIDKTSHPGAQGK